MAEIVWKPAFEPPESATRNYAGINHPGLLCWKNTFNGFVVCATHYTSDPDKRTTEWYKQATANMRYDQVQREFEIDFSSRAGERAFPFLEEHQDKYRIDDIPLDQIPKHWRIIAALDYGSREPTSIHIYGIDEYRRFYAIWEFYKPSHYKEIAQALKGTLPDNPHPLWPRIEKVVADPSIFRNDQENPMAEELQSRADLLRQEGIWSLVRGTNERLAGLERVREMLAYYPATRKVKNSLFIMKRCQKLWWELVNLVYAEVPPHLLQDKNQTEDVKQKNDHCFPAGTMVTTDRGLVPIEDMRPGMMALTRFGFRRVRSGGPTKVAQTYSLFFDDGKSLRCTGNHNIFTKNRGFVMANELRYEDDLVTEDLWSKKKKSSLTGLFIDAIRTQSTRVYAIITLMAEHIAERFVTFTAQFGRASTDQFLLAGTFTTKTGIRSIMSHQTWNAFTQKSIKKSTENSTATNGKQKSISAFSKKEEQQQKHGMLLKKVENGIHCMQSKPGEKSFLKHAFALFAGKNLNLRFQKEQNTVAPAAKLRDFGETRLINRIPSSVELVYNLSIEEHHEYFANGVLVSNSYDDLRYGLMSIEAPSETPVDNTVQGITLDSIEEQLDHSDRQRENDFY